MKTQTSERIQTAVALVPPSKPMARAAQAVPAETVEPTRQEISDAKHNHKIVTDGVKNMAKHFLHMSRALFAINNLKQYKVLGFKTWQKYLDAQDVCISLPQSKGYVRLGRALQFIETSDEEMIAVGYASMLELSRLAQTKEMTQQHIDEIVDYITMRATGTITHAKLKVEVDEILGVSKPQLVSEDTEGDGDAVESAERATTAIPTDSAQWKKDVIGILKASTGLKDFVKRVSAYVTSQIMSASADSMSAAA